MAIAPKEICQMKSLTTLSALLLTTLAAMPANAQVGIKQESDSSACIATTPTEQIALNAAKNEARQMAEVTNGGLSVYRAEPAMHGAAIASPCEMLAPNVWRFTFRGGNPTAVVVAEDYTVLSVVTVEGTGRDRQVSLDYIGPIDEYIKQP